MSPGQYRARVKIARRIIDQGGCCVDLADEVGVSKAAISAWFRNHPELEDIYKSLCDNRRAGPAIVGTEATRVRLLLKVAQREMSLSEAARIIGVSPAALCQWRARNWTALEERLAA